MEKIQDFGLRNKGREKTQIVKIPKSCHQVKWTKIIRQQRESVTKFLISESLNGNSLVNHNKVGLFAVG